MRLSKHNTAAVRSLRHLAKPNSTRHAKPLAKPSNRQQSTIGYIPRQPPSIVNSTSSAPAMSFPCLDRLEQRTRNIAENGPEPAYARASGYKTFSPSEPLLLDFGHALREYSVAYETWGTLNADKSNAILLHTGLSANSHAKSHVDNPAPGWWEKFIGPGLSIDTNKFFVICTNVLGGCAGSTGPSSLHPDDGERYATRFPMLSVHDMVRAQHRLVTEELGISKLYASVGSSMGGMQSLALASDFPHFASKVASISGCARSHPSSIAMRFVQRQVLMSDPNWNRGFYYDGIIPHVGMKLARQIATISYRSGPEWEERFGRDRLDNSKPPALCPDFLIETYLDHQGEKFFESYDANSLLYISKAMDLFDLGARNAAQRSETRGTQPFTEENCAVPSTPYTQIPRENVMPVTMDDLVEGMQGLKGVDSFVLGVESDVLFPAWQQREVAHVLEKINGSADKVEYVELSHRQSKFGHDTFLLDLEHVGKPLKQWLERGL